MEGEGDITAIVQGAACKTDAFGEGALMFHEILYVSMIGFSKAPCSNVICPFIVRMGGGAVADTALAGCNHTDWSSAAGSKL